MHNPFRDLKADWMRPAKDDDAPIDVLCTECGDPVDNANANVCTSCLEKALKDVEAFDS